MTGWWRSNAIALGAIVLLVPATYAALTWNEWSAILQSSDSRPIALEPGDTLEYAGATIGPVTSTYSELPSAPRGTKIVTVTVKIDPGGPPIICDAPVLHESGADPREWKASSDLGRDWDPDLRTFCSSEETGPYQLDLDYLVPDDASGPFTLELGSAAGRPEFVSAVVDP